MPWLLFPIAWRLAQSVAGPEPLTLLKERSAHPVREPGKYLAIAASVAMEKVPSRSRSKPFARPAAGRVNPRTQRSYPVAPLLHCPMEGSMIVALMWIWPAEVLVIAVAIFLVWSVVRKREE
jgi:hypothetical protein